MRSNRAEMARDAFDTGAAADAADAAGAALAAAPPLRPTDPPSRRTDGAILAAMIHSSDPGNSEVARNKLVGEGLLDAAFTPAHLKQRFDELCREATSMQRERTGEASDFV